MRGDVLGAVERRRRWTDAEKFALAGDVRPILTSLSFP